MKNRTLTALIPGMACMASLAAFAQQEQWLEYHTGTEPRGYQWIDLSPAPPEGAGLPPKLEGALFGRWKAALEKSDGRLICIQRSRAGGLWDTLYVDCNGNGSLGDEKPVSATQRSSSSSSFPAIKLTFKGEDGPLSYHLLLRHYKTTAENGQLLAGAGCWYEGDVQFGEKKHRIQLIDSTLNGVFNDTGDDASECDSVSMGGENGTRVYLGELLEVDNQFWKVEVARDGAFLKVRKAEGVEQGTVRVSEEVTGFSVIGKKGHFTRKPTKGESRLPVGVYRLSFYTLERKDSNKANWKLNGNNFSSATAFEVKASEPVVFKIGEPVEALLEATQEKSRVSFNLKLAGPMGETVDIMKGNQRPRAPQLVVASARGDFKSTNTFEYG